LLAIMFANVSISTYFVKTVTKTICMLLVALGKKPKISILH